jgi:septal ring-binding cell division protein DamX
LTAIMSEEAATAGKGLLSSALLVSAVAAILLAGFVLKSDPQGAANRPPVAPVATPAAPALGSPIAPELGAAEPPSPAPTPVPTPEPEPPAATIAKPKDTAPPPPVIDAALSRLAVRAESDAERLAKASGRWTAQLLVACKPETVDRLLGRGGGSTKVFVLPARVHDDPCFRVCYGEYKTAADAAAAADLPKALRGSEKIAAVEIAKVIP